MAKFNMLVFYNPREGMESEFNRYLDQEHIPEILELDGFTAAQRFRLALTREDRNPPVHYLTVYEIETDDIEEFHRNFMAEKERNPRPGPDTIVPESLSSRYFEAISERIVAR
jgi:hypothetical protein